MKIDLTEREMKVVYTKLKYYMVQNEFQKDMGYQVKHDGKEVRRIMNKLLKAFNFEN